ncbi:MAG: SDR family NAD(P)-dependent oxidoreductase [Myxococcaceae bacterium]
MNAPLEGRVALVTGSSRGIGQAVALSLAQAGATLVLTSTREGGAEKTRRAVVALGREALAVVYDAARPGDADRLLASVHETFGAVDLLVNNAAVVKRAKLADTSDQDFERVLAVNLSGPFSLCRRIVPSMVSRGQGRVVNVSSISGTLGSPGLSAYCASKWGLNGLTRSLAAEVEGTGVMIAAVLPGSVDTAMLKGSGFEPDMSPAEVAGVVRYLCAEAPLAMNGSLVEVFG